MLSLGPTKNQEPAGALAEAVNKVAMQLPERVMIRVKKPTLTRKPKL